MMSRIFVITIACLASPAFAQDDVSGFVQANVQVHDVESGGSCEALDLSPKLRCLGCAVAAERVGQDEERCEKCQNQCHVCDKHCTRDVMRCAENDSACQESLPWKECYSRCMRKAK